MYNDLILNRLSNLKYLNSTKNSNITVTSKKNQYNDVVKFYARIDKQENIQKISFKATGCTYFLVFCDYFCELVEGKNIKEALKINGDNLQKLMDLSDSKIHVADIILGTFALLVKKYRKGIEKGIILPCDENSPVKKTTTKKTEEKINDRNSKSDNKDKKGLRDILVSLENKHNNDVAKKSEKEVKNNDKSTKDKSLEDKKETKKKSKEKKEKRGLFSRKKKSN